MIKRRFYKHDHGDRDAPTDSSSSSDSELEAEATEEEEEEEDEDENNDVAAEVRGSNVPCSSSSGYESENSSAREVDLDSSGLPTNEDYLETGDEGPNVTENHSSEKINAGIVDLECNINAQEDELPSDLPNCVLKSKSVFKCKLCPRVVCLTEETLRAHLKSKRHARSEKLLSEGRLKLMLNSDGELEEETHQERHASTLAATELHQNATNSNKKNKGRQRQRKRVKKKGEDLAPGDTKTTKKPSKKRRKTNS